MKMVSKKKVLLALIVSFALIISGCSSAGSGAEGKYILDADSVAKLITQDKTVFVDMQKPEEYAKAHIKGAVNITRSDIVINEPVANMLAPKEVIEDVMGANGISNDTLVIAYDNTDNMDAARLWWTLKVYGHDNVKVISGGIKALQKEGLEIVSDKTSISPASFTAKDKNTSLIATKKDMLAQVNEPNKDVILLDTRTQEEFDQGTIPGSVLFDYQNNNNQDGTYKSAHAIITLYHDLGIKPENTVMMYCKTSIRAAQTYLALANAGYENLKIFDGAWLEWSADSSLPIQKPDQGSVQPSEGDHS